MRPMQVVYGLQFDDDAIFDQDIEPVPADLDPFIVYDDLTLRVCGYASRLPHPRGFGGRAWSTYLSERSQER